MRRAASSLAVLVLLSLSGAELLAEDAVPTLSPEDAIVWGREYASALSQAAESVARSTTVGFEGSDKQRFPLQAGSTPLIFVAF